MPEPPPLATNPEPRIPNPESRPSPCVISMTTFEFMWFGRYNGGMSVAVELRDVSVSYPGGVQALSGVTMSVAQGEFAFLVGPTGHGKSTVLRLLYREEVPTTGQVFVSGWDVPRLSQVRIPYLRRRIGVVFSDFRLLPQRTAGENIEFVLRATSAACESVEDCVHHALEQVGLADRANDYPGQLSAGEQQRLAIARALAPDPPWCSPTSLPAISIPRPPPTSLNCSWPRTRRGRRCWWPPTIPRS